MRFDETVCRSVTLVFSAQDHPSVPRYMEGRDHCLLACPSPIDSFQFEDQNL